MRSSPGRVGTQSGDNYSAGRYPDVHLSAWFYLRNDNWRLPAYISKILTERPESWGYEVSPPECQAKLKVYTDALRRLEGKGLTAAAVVANFHWQRMLPLFKLTPEAPSKGSWMMEEALSHEITAQRAGCTVAPPPTGLRDLWGIKMRPEVGYIQLVRSISKHWLLVSYFSS